MDHWYFDLQGANQDEWVWRVVNDRGTLVKLSSRKFRYYLDCVEDAKKAGYVGPPHFRTPGIKTRRA